MREALGMFKWSILATVVALGAAWAYDGARGVAIVAILIALESSISFDNAVVNAGVLRRMSPAWQRAFLTIGIVIAVFGMRVVFPVLIVAVSTTLSLPDVVDQALNDKEAYARNVERAAPVIGALGGAFLLMVALTFFLDEDREQHWIGPVERRLARAGALQTLPTAITAAAILAVAQLAPGEDERDVLFAGLAGLTIFLVVRGAADLLSRATSRSGATATGAAGLAAFLYLEMLDASFSLDGVLGAFAISTDVVVIALGLGVGAIYVRTLTVYLVRRGTLQRYRYLSNGAHWAIAGLAVVLFVSTEHHVPEWLTATIGLGFIAASFASSVVANNRT